MGVCSTKEVATEVEKEAEKKEDRAERAFSTQVDLENSTLKNVERFTFSNIEVDAKVVKVYDGDTCTCVFDAFGLGLYNHQVRLNGIDTADLKSTNHEVKDMALRTWYFVSTLMLNKIVRLKCGRHR